MGKILLETIELAIASIGHSPSNSCPMSVIKFDSETSMIRLQDTVNFITKKFLTFGQIYPFYKIFSKLSQMLNES